MKNCYSVIKTIGEEYCRIGNKFTVYELNKEYPLNFIILIHSHFIRLSKLSLLSMFIKYYFKCTLLWIDMIVKSVNIYEL